MGAAMTIGDLMGQALAAYEQLATAAEAVEDGWTYVMDLSAAWQERMGESIAARGGEPAGASERAAIERVVDEVGQVRDPHRAIDWLSTFPQVVLSALGERP